MGCCPEVGVGGREAADEGRWGRKAKKKVRSFAETQRDPPSSLSRHTLSPGFQDFPACLSPSGVMWLSSGQGPVSRRTVPASLGTASMVLLACSWLSPVPPAWRWLRLQHPSWAMKMRPLPRGGGSVTWKQAGSQGLRGAPHTTPGLNRLPPDVYMRKRGGKKESLSVEATYFGILILRVSKLTDIVLMISLVITSSFLSFPVVLDLHFNRLSLYQSMGGGGVVWGQPSPVIGEAVQEGGEEHGLAKDPPPSFCTSSSGLATEDEGRDLPSTGHRARHTGRGSHLLLFFIS